MHFYFRIKKSQKYGNGKCLKFLYTYIKNTITVAKKTIVYRQSTSSLNSRNSV